MNEFAVLTNRKRALIALVHSVVFLGLALRGFGSTKPALTLHSSGAATGLVMVFIYVTVASVLAWLARIARCTKERVYFALCASSASFGLLRALFGDAGLPAAQYLRVFLLTCAVLMGMWVFRSHAVRMLPENECAYD